MMSETPTHSVNTVATCQTLKVWSHALATQRGGAAEDMDADLVICWGLQLKIHKNPIRDLKIATSYQQVQELSLSFSPTMSICPLAQRTLGTPMKISYGHVVGFTRDMWQIKSMGATFDRKAQICWEIPPDSTRTNCGGLS